ncbi:hypothetical protein FQZ97_542870 [compost metagenome]
MRQGQLQHAHDRVHRRPNLVADGRQECCFGPVSAFRAVSGDGKLLHDALALRDVHPAAHHAHHGTARIAQRFDPVLHIHFATADAHRAVFAQRDPGSQNLPVILFDLGRLDFPDHQLRRRAHRLGAQLFPGPIQQAFECTVAGQELEVTATQDDRLGNSVKHARLKRHKVLQAPFRTLVLLVLAAQQKQRDQCGDKPRQADPRNQAATHARPRAAQCRQNLDGHPIRGNGADRRDFTLAQRRAGSRRPKRENKWGRVHDQII